MKYNPKHEGYVFVAIRELGLASIQEIQEFVEKYLKAKLEKETVRLYAERWRARDFCVVDLSAKDKRYKIAKIPPPFRSLKMENVKNLRNKDWKKSMDTINQEFPEQNEPVGPTKGKIGNYVTVKITLETIDPILGGTPSDDGILKLHRNSEGKPVITPAQFKGWVRQNGRVVGWNANVRAWIGYGFGELTEEPKLIQVQAPIVAHGRGKGIQKYEALDRGTKLETVWTIPLRGSGINKIEDLQKFGEVVANYPVRGLGSNPYYKGGRVKIVEVKEVT